MNRFLHYRSTILLLSVILFANNVPLQAASAPKAIEIPAATAATKNNQPAQRSLKQVIRSARHAIPYVALLGAYFARQELSNVFVRNHKNDQSELLFDALKETCNKVFDTMLTVLIIKTFIEAHGQTIKELVGVCGEPATC